MTELAANPPTPQTTETLATSLKKNRQLTTRLKIEKEKNKHPDTQKQEFGSPSLQASLRCQTHAFLPPHLLRG